jgi:hypothetical protein
VRFLEILKQNGKVLWTSLTTICSKGIFQHDIATPLQLNELASLAEIRHHHRITKIKQEEFEDIKGVIRIR